ncbi:hypothetical protein DFJ77DRAFT_508636 [Powellomyces hirtus]|nr:hypothetical protein DFJ77DRAFT_508636 [Powellomyces hirtus]
MEQQAEENETQGPNEELDDMSSIPSQSEPLAHFRDAVTFGDPSDQIWSVYQSLSKWERRFLIRDDYRDVLCAVAGLPDDVAVDACLRVLADMDMAKVRPLVREYRIGFRLCVRSRRLDAAEMLFARLDKDRIDPEKSFYEDLIVLYGYAGELNKASGVYRAMIEAGYQRSDVVYGAMMDAATRKGNLRQAELLFNEMRAVGLKPTVEAFAALIYGNVKHERCETAMGLLRDMTRMNLQPTVRTYTHLISGQLRAGNRDTVSYLKRLMDLSGLEPDSVYYGTLINGAARAGALEEVDHLLQEMETRNVVPCDVIYDSIVAGALHYADDVDSILTAVDRIMKLGVGVQDRMLNTILLGFSKTRNVAGAAKLLAGWKEDGRQVSPVHYTTYLHLLAESEGVPAALGYINDLVAKEEYTPEAGMYNAILSVACKATEQSDVLMSEILSAMRSMGVAPDTWTYNTIMRSVVDPHNLTLLEKTATESNCLDAVGCSTLMSHAARRNDPEEAQRIFNMMKALDIPMAKQTWTAFAQVYGNVGDVAKMEHVFQNMKQEGWDMDGVAYTALITAYVDVGDIQGAERTWQELIASGHPLSVVSFTSMLVGYLKAADHHGARHLMADLAARGLKADVVLHSQLLRWIGDTQGPKGIDHALRELADNSDIVPDRILYNTILNEHKRHGQVDKIVPTVADMLDRNITPDSYTYAAIFQSLITSRNRDRLLQDLFAHLQTRNVSPTAELYEELIKAYTRTTDVDGILDAWTRFEESGLRVSGRLLATCVRGLRMCGPQGLEQAQMIWKTMMTPELKKDGEVRQLLKELRSGKEVTAQATKTTTTTIPTTTTATAKTVLQAPSSSVAVRHLINPSWSVSSRRH